MKRLRQPRDEQGSMIVLIAVILVATSLVVVLIDVVSGGLRNSRRFGDSANALQVADAGVNDAVTAVGEQPTGQTAGYSFTRTGGIGEGIYTYTATLDFYQVNPTMTAPVWHVDALGTDARGLQRRVKADVVAEPLFAQAIFSKGSGVFGTGLAVDSYDGGSQLSDTCNGKGIVGTNSPSTLEFGGPGNPSGGAHVNCQWMPTPGVWPVDACIAYYAPENLATGTYPPGSGTSGHCPTIRSQPGILPGTWKDAPLFKPPSVGSVSGVTLQSSLTCDDGGDLVAGNVYYVTTLNLRNGCRIAGGDPRQFSPTPTGSSPESGAVKVFVAAGGLADIGGNGAGDMINEPPHSDAVSTGPCGPTGQQSNALTVGVGQVRKARSWFCPGWPRTLQVYVQGNGTVRFDNNDMKFWGVIANPGGTTEFSAPNLDVFGAMVTGSAGGSGGNTQSPQWNWHYDESLSGILTGRYFLQHWRECPTTSVTAC